MPARPWRKDPFDRACSQVSSGVETCTKMNLRAVRPYCVPFANCVRRSIGAQIAISAILGDFRGDVTNAANVDIAMFFGKSEFRGKSYAPDAIQKGDWTSASFQKLMSSNWQMSIFPEPESPVKKQSHPCGAADSSVAICTTAGK